MLVQQLKFKLISSISGKMQVLIHLILLVSRLLENLENFFNPLKALLKGQSIKFQNQKTELKSECCKRLFCATSREDFQNNQLHVLLLGLYIWNLNVKNRNGEKGSPHHKCHTQFEFNTEKECHCNSKQHTHCLSILPEISNFLKDIHIFCFRSNFWMIISEFWDIWWLWWSPLAWSRPN